MGQHKNKCQNRSFEFSEQKIPKQLTSTVCWSKVWNAGSFHPSSTLRRRQIYCTRKPQFPESYRVPDNGRTITVQLHFSGQQEQRFSIQEHRLELKFHSDMRIKRRSLHNPNFFPVRFTSVIALGFTKFLMGYDNFRNFLWLAQYVANSRKFRQIFVGDKSKILSEKFKISVCHLILG